MKRFICFILISFSCMNGDLKNTFPFYVTYTDVETGRQKFDTLRYAKFISNISFPNIDIENKTYKDSSYEIYTKFIENMDTGNSINKTGTSKLLIVSKIYKIWIEGEYFPAALSVYLYFNSINLPFTYDVKKEKNDINCLLMDQGGENFGLWLGKSGSISLTNSTDSILLRLNIEFEIIEGATEYFHWVTGKIKKMRLSSTINLPENIYNIYNDTKMGNK